MHTAKPIPLPQQNEFRNRWQKNSFSPIELFNVAYRGNNFDLITFLTELEDEEEKLGGKLEVGTPVQDFGTGVSSGFAVPQVTKPKRSTAVGSGI